jgi:hypothetical protein
MTVTRTTRTTGPSTSLTGTGSASRRAPDDPNQNLGNNPPNQGGAPGGGGGGAPGGGGGDGGGPPDGGPAPQVPPQDANQPPIFGLTPGTAGYQIIDYNSKAGYSKFKAGTSALNEELYDCSPDGFYQFIQDLKSRAEAFGWSRSPDGILWIPATDDANAERINILEEWGRLSLERVTNHEQTYLFTQTRAAQDDRMLYECILNSVSKTGRAKLNIWYNQYKLANPNDAQVILPSGLCLLKVLIRESHLDTNATTSMIRTKLTNLDAYIQTIGNDISKFNSYVKMLLSTLESRGETTQDLLTNLFKGYAACSDKNFVKYIARKQEDYEEGAENALSANQLMEMADQKYRTLKAKEIWEAPSSEEEKLIALESRVDELKKKLNRYKKQDGSDTKTTPSNQSEGGGKQYQKKEKPAWLKQNLKPSNADLRKPKNWNGRDWWWCGPETGGKCNPGQYRAHKPSECRGHAGNKKRKTDHKGGSNKKVVIKEAIDTTLEGGYQSE